MKPEIFENNAEGIKQVYRNDEWSVNIKNWKPDNDIAGVEKLEIHYTTDEQFVLVGGKALLITADEKDGEDKDKPAEEDFQEPVSIVWETNGRVEPHQVWIYPDGAKPEDGLSIKVDAFGGAKVLAGDGREE